MALLFFFFPLLLLLHFKKTSSSSLFPLRSRFFSHGRFFILSFSLFLSLSLYSFFPPLCVEHPSRSTKRSFQRFTDIKLLPFSPFFSLSLPVLSYHFPSKHLFDSYYDSSISKSLFFFFFLIKATR